MSPAHSLDVSGSVNSIGVGVGAGQNGLAPEDVFILPPSLGQERFWLLDCLEPGNPAWNVPVRFRLQGMLDSSLVERALNEIVTRHEALRTSFTIADGQPAQVIKSSLRIAVPLADLRHLPKPDRAAAVDRLSFEEARRRFDLRVGPLFRASLLQIEDDEHVLLVTPHHSVADYWSIGLISNELGALYEAYSQRSDPILSPLPVQYGDFAVWQRDQLESTVVRSELDYWKRQLADLPPIEIPTDRPRPDFPTYDATITSILLPVNLTDKMKELANQAGATFFNTMLAALGVILHQYTGQIDLGVATQVAGRNNVELEPLIGLFINTIVLRLDLGGDPSFPQLVGRVQEVGLQALANQNVRFEQLLKELRPHDYPSHHTLFRVNFICQRDPVKPLEFSGIKLTVVPSKSQGALYDLNIFLVLRAEGWRLACEYNTDLFDSTTISCLLNDYRLLLDRLVENPDLPISQLPPAEGAKRLKQKGEPAPEASCPSAQLPTESSYALPASSAQRRFWALEEMSPGNPALHMRACVKLSGILSVARLEESLQLLVDRHETLRTTFERADEEIIQLAAPTRRIPLHVTSLENGLPGDREATLWEEIRTEASIGFNLVEGPLIRSRLFRLQQQEHVLVITTHHILTDGWSQNVIQRDLWAIYEALTNGQEPSLPPLVVQYGDFVHWQQNWVSSDGAREQIEFWKQRLSEPLPILDLPTAPVTSIQAASSPMETLLLPDDLVQSLKSLGKTRDATMFMVMLAGYSALLNRYTGRQDLLIGSPVANRRPETEGLIGPFAGPIPLRFDLSGDPTLRELLARIRDVTLDALSHADVPFEVLLENLHVRWVGGRNPLSQCYFFYQTAFLQPRQLCDLTVTPLPDIGLGTHFELQMGLLERREGVRAQLEYNPKLFDRTTIREFLDRYGNLLHAFVADPEQRLSALPQFTAQTPSRVAISHVPQTEILPADNTEKQLAGIWEDLLGTRPIGRRQNFFELGGNSLLAVRLFAKIEHAFDIKLPLSSLIEAQTIEEVARLIRSHGTAVNWSPLVTLQAGGSRPNFFCVHGAGGEILLYRDLARHMGSDQPFHGLQAQGLNGEQPILTRIEDMASLYISEIKRVQPQGPYFLGGYCMGGTIAFEMAQQFTAQGDEVVLLALLDTMNWSRLTPGSVSEKARHQLQRLWFHIGNFNLLTFSGKSKFLREKLKTLRSRLPVWGGMISGKLIKNTAGEASESLLLARLWETNDQAIQVYQPRPYPGSITDVRPMKQYTRYASVDLKWDNLALGGQKVVTLRAYPTAMLLEPFVAELAAALRAAIDESLQADSATLPIAAPARTAPSSDGPLKAFSTRGVCQ